MSGSRVASEPLDNETPRGLLIGLVALALGLRVIGLNGGLWIDEITSLLDSFRPPLAQIVTVFPYDNQHPLYSILAHLSLTAFGESAWAIRLPALLFGVASVPLLYALGRQVATRLEAILAAALLTVSYHHIWFSQNARGYTALAFFTMASTLLLLKGFSDGSWRTYLAYALAAGLGAYTHLTMVFVVVGQALVVTAVSLARDPEGRRFRFGVRPFLAIGLSGLITIVLYAPVLTQMQQFFMHTQSQLKGVSTPSWAVTEAFRVLMLGLGAGLGTLAAVVVLVAVTLFVAGLWSYAREEKVVLALFVTPALVTLLGALAARGTMYPRFFFSLIGFGILIGVRGVMVAAGWLATRVTPSDPARGAGRVGTAVMGFAILLSLISLIPNYRYPKQDFAGARQWVEAERGPDDAIAMAGAAVLPYQRYLKTSWSIVTDRSELDTLRRTGHPTWVVYTFARYLERASPALMAAITEDCQVAHRFRGTVGGGDIVVSTCPALSAPLAGASPS